MNQSDWRGWVRILTYQFNFHSEPGADVANAVNGITMDPHEGMTQEDYIKQIDLALASTEDLGKLAPNSRSDQEIRQFLSQVKKALAK